MGERIRCNNCGNRIRPNDETCPHCGMRFKFDDPYSEEESEENLSAVRRFQKKLYDNADNPAVSIFLAICRGALIMLAAGVIVALICLIIYIFA